MAKRFSNPSLKNIQSGLLLSPGPVSVLQAVRGLSGVFHNAVTKQKFLMAASKLEAANLGSLVVLEVISRQCHVFVKKPPSEEVEAVVNSEDLCSYGEYVQQYMVASSKAISEKIKQHVVLMGLVPAEVFQSVTTATASPGQPGVKMEFSG